MVVLFYPRNGRIATAATAAEGDDTAEISPLCVWRGRYCCLLLPLLLLKAARRRLSTRNVPVSNGLGRHGGSRQTSSFLSLGILFRVLLFTAIAASAASIASTQRWKLLVSLKTDRTLAENVHHNINSNPLYPVFSARTPSDLRSLVGSFVRSLARSKRSISPRALRRRNDFFKPCGLFLPDLLLKLPCPSLRLSS